MATLSAVIITKDEAAKLAGCLESLRDSGVVAEIVVVDDASTDETVAIARRYTEQVLVHPHEGENWDLNKNVGMDAATGDWCLLIDADERLTPEGAAVLRDFLAASGETTATSQPRPPAAPSLSEESPPPGSLFVAPATAYWLPRREWYFGRWAHHAASGAQVLRLVRRGAARFEGDRLHAHPTIDGAIGFLDAPLDHLAYDSIAAYVAKTQAYTDHEARVRFAAGERVGIGTIVKLPLQHLSYRYLKCQGYKDGITGLVYCGVTALYPLLQSLKLWKLAHQRPAQPD